MKTKAVWHFDDAIIIIKAKWLFLHGEVAANYDWLFKLYYLSALASVCSYLGTQPKCMQSLNKSQ